MLEPSELTSRIERLQRILLFKGIKDDAEAIREVAVRLKIVTMPSGQQVLTEGEEGKELFLMRKGIVGIEKKTLQGDPYTVVDLSAAEHAFFGEMALLDNDKRSATVVCKTDCEFYVLQRQDFIELGNRHPAIGLAITRELSLMLCRRLRKANDDIITLFNALVGEVVENEGLEE